MLRGESSRARVVLAVALVGVVGAVAATLVAQGNPGNMGVCGACFLRDVAGSFRMHAAPPAYFRPEVAGLVVGAFVAVAASRRFVARSGSYGAARFALGLWMGIAALVFLGCPFRMLQRMGGGDLAAWAALPGFVGGVGIGMLFERRGYSIGKTAPAPAAVGLLAPLAIAAAFALFLAGALHEGPNQKHAPVAFSLVAALVAGAALSLTGFCAVTAGRQAWHGRKTMLLAALAFVGLYAAASAAHGSFRLATHGQPIAHADWLWNFLSLGLLGLTGALAGGCPVRQVVMAGEGNGDAWLAVIGLLVGGAVAHGLKLVSAAASPTSPGGPTEAGKVAVAIGWAFALAYAAWVTRAHARAPSTATPPPPP